jgi:hypothetical protein
MASDVAPLPREPDTLIEMVLELRDENGKLRAMLETLRRTLYGARSERFDAAPGQLALGLEDVSSAPVEPEPDVAKPRSQDGRTRAKPVRNIGGLPKHLPREDVVIEPATDLCPCCCGALHRIGEDVSEMLDIVPAILRVKRIHRPRYGCRACESAVVQPRRRRGRSTAGCPPRHCWRISRRRSSPGTYRCIARPRCWRATASVWTARPWSTGLAGPCGGCSRSTPC